MNQKELLKSKGADFLFPFDLLAHTCGKSATLRVLSYTAPSFEKLCQHVILNEKITKTGTSLKIEWEPAMLQELRQNDKIEVEEYVATIYSPGTAFHDWCKLSQNLDLWSSKPLREEQLNIWLQFFCDGW